MFLLYADKCGHFECSVNFGQLLCWHVFWLVFDFWLFQKMNQRICIKFCVKNKIKCAEAFRMCWLWQMVKLPWTEATFIGGTKCWPRAEKMWTRKNVPVNRRITVREVAEDLDISIGSCHSFFSNDLGMTRLAAKFAAATVFPRSGPCDFFLLPKEAHERTTLRYD